MGVHYLLIALIIVVIIIFQIGIYSHTKKKRKQFEGIFPEDAEKELIIKNTDSVQIVSKLKEAETKKKYLEDSINKIKKELNPIEKAIKKYEALMADTTDEDVLSQYKEILDENNIIKHELLSSCIEKDKQKMVLQKEIEVLQKLCDSPGKETRKEIIDSINRYLKTNKTAVADFSLIRDIIDRNCDAVEDEIQTQIPIPLYFGLIGTMLGILIGVGSLVITGSLESLLTSFQTPLGLDEGSVAWINAKTLYDAQATQGITSLFGGIALAMISSIIGIILTTMGSWKNKNTNVLAEKRKHTFISWLQAELLPKLSTDFSTAIIKLGNDLVGFNSTFSANADLLKQTITEIGNTTEEQSKLLNSIERLDVAKIAKANITVYEQLKSCTDDISCLAKDLRDVQSSIKGIGQFMQDGINEYESRNTFIQDASAKVDIAIREGQNKLTEETKGIFQKYDELLHTLYSGTSSTTKNLAQKYEEEADRLHSAIVAKLTDFKQLENELKNLVDVKKGIVNLEKTTNEQNRKIDSLTNAIHELAQVKATGGSTHMVMKIPTAYKALIIVAGSIITLTSFFFVILRVLESFDIVL